MENNTKTKSIGCSSIMYIIIQSVFIILKCAGVTAIASWTWPVVLIPTWIMLGGIATLLLIYVIVWIIAACIK